VFYHYLVLQRHYNSQGLQMRHPKFKYHEAINLIDFSQSPEGITLLPPTCFIIKMRTIDKIIFSIEVNDSLTRVLLHCCLSKLPINTAPACSLIYTLVCIDTKQEPLGICVFFYFRFWNHLVNCIFLWILCLLQNQTDGGIAQWKSIWLQNQTE